MADLLGRGPAAGTLLQIVGVGVKRLSDMREGSTEGAALERALVAGLDVLSVAFESDGPFLVPGAAGAGARAAGAWQGGRAFGVVPCMPGLHAGKPTRGVSAIAPDPT